MYFIRREKALRACRCGVRKAHRYYQRQTSSSSDGMKNLPPAVHERKDRRKKKDTAQVLVNYVENKPNDGQTVTVTVTDDMCECSDDSIQNNNQTLETVVEQNGNVDLKVHKLDNCLPDVAQV